MTNFCPLCQQFLREKAKQLLQTAINAILNVNSKESVDRPHVASSDDNDSITNDEEEASDNDTTNDNNLKELIQSINSGILALSPPPPPPTPIHFHYLFHSNLKTSKNSPHSKAILQLSIKSLTVGSVDIQEKVINFQRIEMFNVLTVKMAFVQAMFVQGKHSQHHIHWQ